MSWLFERNKKGQYAWWTTIADGWMTNPKWLSRDDMVEIIIAHKREQFNKEMRELRKTFPQGWFNKNHKRYD